MVVANRNNCDNTALSLHLTTTTQVNDTMIKSIIISCTSRLFLQFSGACVADAYIAQFGQEVDGDDEFIKMN